MSNLANDLDDNSNPTIRLYKMKQEAKLWATKEQLIRDNEKNRKQIEFCEYENKKFAWSLIKDLTEEHMKGEWKELIADYIKKCIELIFEVRTCTKGVITKDWTIYFVY